MIRKGMWELLQQLATRMTEGEWAQSPFSGIPYTPRRGWWLFGRHHWPRGVTRPVSPGVMGVPPPTSGLPPPEWFRALPRDIREAYLTMPPAHMEAELARWRNVLEAGDVPVAPARTSILEPEDASSYTISSQGPRIFLDPRVGRAGPDIATHEFGHYHTYPVSDEYILQALRHLQQGTMPPGVMERLVRNYGLVVDEVKGFLRSMPPEELRRRAPFSARTVAEEAAAWEWALPRLRQLMEPEPSPLFPEMMHRPFDPFLRHPAWQTEAGGWRGAVPEPWVAA